MTEPNEIDATSLDDIAAVIVTIPIRRPDGKTVRVKMRTLEEQRVWEIRRSMTWPQAPIKDYQKIRGEVVPQRDFADPAYQLAVDEAHRTFMGKLILASLILDVPGETEAEKLAALRGRVGQYAFDVLVEAVNRMNITPQEDIAAMAASFRPAPAQGASGNGATAHDPGPVAGTAAG